MLNCSDVFCLNSTHLNNASHLNCKYLQKSSNKNEIYH